jgi:hypothetical protein
MHGPLAVRLGIQPANFRFTNGETVLSEPDSESTAAGDGPAAGGGAESVRCGGPKLTAPALAAAGNAGPGRGTMDFKLRLS